MESYNVLIFRLIPGQTDKEKYESLKRLLNYAKYSEECRDYLMRSGEDTDFVSNLLEILGYGKNGIEQNF